jgi:hypothetical protein
MTEAANLFRGSKLTVAAVFLLCTAALAQTFHVTSVRDWAATDPAPVSRAFKTYVVTGTSGAVRYTAQQLFSRGSQRFEVGQELQAQTPASNRIATNSSLFIFQCLLSL